MKKLYFKLMLFVLMLGNFPVLAQNTVQFDVSYDPQQCAPVPVMLINNSIINTYTGTVYYNWYMNGVLFSTDQYPATTDFQGGNYDIRLEVTDSLGFLGDYYQFIYIKGFSGKFYTYPEGEAAPGQPVQFYSNDMSQQWIVWKLHTGETLKYNYAQYIYNTIGVYPVKMTISTECGIDTVTQWINITNSAVPGAEITVSNYEVCPNDEFILTASEAFQHEWNIGGNILNGKEIYYAFGDIGVHPVILKNTNEFGNSSFDTAYINVRNDIYVSAEFSPYYENQPCPNNEIKFEAYSSGTFEWDFGDGSAGFGKRVYNTYVDTGIYNVTLYATNGCGTQAVSSMPIYIYYDQYSGVTYPNFYFDNIENGWVESINVCPNDLVTVVNETYQDAGTTLHWLIDGVEYYQDEVSIYFPAPGVYEIQLIAQNNCMASDTATKWVYVDSYYMPESNLSVAPIAICPNEKVYFFDDHLQFNENGTTVLNYSINFGDGQTQSNITGLADDVMEVLAVHTYADTGLYNFSFIATNNCNNSDTLKGQILVNDDPNRTPFYYINNTTAGDEMEGEFENWGVIPDRQYQTFYINVNLTNWNYCGLMDSSVYVFFWYGLLDMNNPDLGPPNGYVELSAPGTAVAYVPFNVVKPSVGLAAVWYCNKDYFDKDPQVYALPIDTVTLLPIQSYPTVPGGIATIPDTITLDAIQWYNESMCTCTPPSDNIKGTWSYQTDDGYYHILDIYDAAEDSLRYRASAGPDPWDGRTDYSYGTLNLLNDSTMQLYPEDSSCFEIGVYNYKVINNEQLLFTINYDNCIDRSNYLTADIFGKYNYDQTNNPDDKTGCPGDTIGFKVVGGISYEWHIRGTVTTEPFTYYVYDTAGIYEEYVVTTNACNRTDTIYTKVIIGMDNVPEPYWSVNKWTAKRFEPLQFYVESHSDFNNYSYLWEFGDGTTSTEMNPEHFYTMEGNYKVKLTVTNGCGSTFMENFIWVTKETSTCEAKFVYSLTGTTVNFQNLSLGNVSSFFWEFGDGKVSTKPNPQNIYPEEGMYTVVLTIYDSINDCSDQIVKQIMVGTIGCLANFNYTVNNITRTVSFYNLSSGDISEYYWDFGDGDYSSNQNPLHTFASDGYYRVCLVTYDEGTQCMSEICKYITVGTPEILADFDYYIDPQNGTVYFADISSGTISDWYWDFGDGNWDVIPEPQHQYAESGEYDVCLSVFNNNTGSFANICKTIMVITDTSLVSTKAGFMYMVSSVTPNKVDFVDQSSGDITNWYWTFGDGTYQSGENVSHTYSAPGLYNVCLIVYDSNTGERSEICKIIQVGIIDCNINANFTYYINPTLKQVSFSDKTTGIADEWFWDFGDGMTSASRNPVHIYSNPGFYLVSLAVRNTLNDCVDYYADFIQVGVAECIADFNFTVTDPVNNTVKFADKSIGDIVDYFWYFDDGTFSTETEPEHTYDFPGLYFVSLTITDATGMCFDFRMKEVQVGTVNCDATFTVFVDSLNNDAYFSNSNIGTATDYYWMFGDGQFDIGPNPIHHYIAPGYFTVSLNTFNSNDNCIDYFEKVILIGNSENDVEADFFYQSDFSTGDVYFYNESMGENLSFIWDFGDGTTSTEENPIHNYSQGGYQFVCLTATNPVTGAVKTSCKLVQTSNQSENNCLAQFNYDINAQEVTFINKSFGEPDVYAWNFGDGNTSTESDPVHTYSSADFYLVELYTYNQTTGCESYDYEYINVGVDNDSIQAIFTYFIDTTGKGKPGGKPVDIIGVGHGGGSKLSWSYGDKKVETGKVTSTTLRPTHVYENPGKYNCCLTIEDPVINQSDTYCDYIMVPYETVISESICEGSEYDFFGDMLSVAGEYIDTTSSVNGVDSIIYLTLTVNPQPVKPTASLTGTTLTSSTASGNQWYFNGTAINGATNQTYTATQSGNYSVVVTDTNGCSSESSDDVNVVISGIEDVESFSMKVFPNPLQSHTRIEYYLSDTKQIKIALYDVAGNLIETIINTYKPAGNHYIIWKNPGLANGIYYLVLTSKSEKITTKLVIQK